MVQISYLPLKARNSVYNIYSSYSDIMNPSKNYAQLSNILRNVYIDKFQILF